MSTAAGNHYITKRKSRSGSIPYGNLPLTLDISFQVKCYQSLTPIQYLVGRRKKGLEIKRKNVKIDKDIFV